MTKIQHHRGFIVETRRPITPKAQPQIADQRIAGTLKLKLA